jgi:hypothetical protein
MVSRLLFAIPLTGILGGLLLLEGYWVLGGRWRALRAEVKSAAG